MSTKNTTATPERLIVSVSITTATREKLLQIAKEKDLKFSDIVRFAINDYIKKENPGKT